MGQAKKRGNYESRKENAIADNLNTIRLLTEQRERWWSKLTPQEKDAIINKRLTKLHTTQTYF